jgi:cytochrome c peroxidase
MNALLSYSRGLQIAAASAAILLSACGGGGGGGAPADASSGTPAAGASAGSSPQVALSTQAASFLNLDLGKVLDYAPVLPAYYNAGVAALDNAAASAATNAPSNPVATLGRVIFHDKRLSMNDTLSCASCHAQSNDFADNKRFSIGFDGSTGTMHAMRLANIRYWQPGSMFWNRRSPTLEQQSTQPIQNPIEMGFDANHGGIPALVEKMSGQPYYAELFAFAFGDGQVTEDRVQRALAQYMRAMVSVNSKWDAAYAQTFDPTLPDKGLDKPAPGLTDQEDRGRHLFMALPSQGGLACAACHVPPTFALKGTSLGNGLDAGETTIFKSPSLKNVGKSATFMHDGRFSSLEEVVDHYASGVQDGPALDPNLKGPDGLPRKRNITPEDKAALVAFLKTLSDPVLAADPRFADPFRQ